LSFCRQRQVVRDVQVHDVLAVDEHDLRSPGGVECAADERASRLGNLAAGDDERMIDKNCPTNLVEGEIKIIGLEPAGDGHRVELETPAATFDVEINSRGVTRMHRR